MVVKFEIKIDLNSFVEGSFYRRTFLGRYARRTMLEAFDEAGVHYFLTKEMCQVIKLLN